MRLEFPSGRAAPGPGSRTAKTARVNPPASISLRADENLKFASRPAFRPHIGRSSRSQDFHGARQVRRHLAIASLTIRIGVALEAAAAVLAPFPFLHFAGRGETGECDE